MKLTKHNIEDWDFRAEIQSGSEQDEFRRANFVDIVAIDAIRVSILAGAVKLGYARVLEDREHLGANPDRVGHFQRWVTSGGLPSTSLMTRSGRRWRRVGKSLWREWQKYGRVKLRLVPTEDQRSENWRRRLDRVAVHGEWNIDEDV